MSLRHAAADTTVNLIIERDDCVAPGQNMQRITDYGAVVGRNPAKAEKKTEPSKIAGRTTTAANAGEPIRSPS
jgi:hypothetical protein